MLMSCNVINIDSEFIEIKSPNYYFKEIFPRVTNNSALRCYLVFIGKLIGGNQGDIWLTPDQILEQGKLSRTSVIKGMHWLEERGFIRKATAGKLGKKENIYSIVPLEDV